LEFRRVLFRSGNDLLDDDRPPVEFSRYKMGGGTDDLNSALERLVIRFAAREGGQKGVMNVDNSVGPARDEFRGEHAHIFRQDQQLRLEWREQPEDFSLMC